MDDVAVVCRQVMKTRWSQSLSRTIRYRCLCRPSGRGCQCRELRPLSSHPLLPPNRNASLPTCPVLSSDKISSMQAVSLHCASTRPARTWLPTSRFPYSTSFYLHTRTLNLDWSAYCRTKGALMYCLPVAISDSVRLCHCTLMLSLVTSLILTAFS